MNDLGTARGSIELDFGKMNASVKKAVEELEKIDAASARTDAEIKLLQSTAEKSGNAFKQAAEKSKVLSTQLEAAKEKVAVYEHEMTLLKEQMVQSEKAQERLAKKIGETKTKYSEAAANVQKMDDALQESKKDLERVAAAQQSYSKTVQAAKDNIKKHNEAIRDAKKIQTDYGKQLREAEKAQKGIAHEIDATKRSIDKLCNSNEKSVDGAQNKLQLLKELKAKLKDLQQAQTAAADAVAKAQSKYDEAGRSVGRMADALSDAKADLDRVTAVYGEHAAETERAKQAVKAHADELAKAKQIQKDYGNEVSALEQTQEGLNREMQTAHTKLDQFGTDCINAKADVNTLSGELRDAQNYALNFATYLDKASDKLKTMGDKTDKFGRSMTMNVTTPIMAAGTAAGTMAYGNIKSESKFASIAKASTEEMEKIAEEARAVSDETSASWTGIYESMYDYTSATQDAAGATKAASIATKSAIGGFTESKVAMNGLTNAMGAYEMEGIENMELLADKFMMTQNLGKTTFGELSSSLGNVTGIAHTAGVGIDELLGAVATTTTAGLNTASAVTGLRQAIAGIISPSQEAVEAAEALNIAWGSDAIRDSENGFRGVISGIRDGIANAAPEYAKLADEAAGYASKQAEATAALKANGDEIAALQKRNEDIEDTMRSMRTQKGYTTSAEYLALQDEKVQNDRRVHNLTAANKELDSSQKALAKSAADLQDQMSFLAEASDSDLAVYTKLFGSVEALNAVMLLTSEEGAKKWTEFTNAIGDSEGAVDEAFDIMMNNPAGQLDKDLNNFRNTAIDLGKELLPILVKVLDIVKPLVDKFNELDDEQQEMLIKAALATAAAGPAISMVGKFEKGLGSIVGVSGKGVKAIAKWISKTKGVKAAADAAAGAVGSTSAGTGLAGALGSTGATVGLIAAIPAALYGVQQAVDVAYNHTKQADFEGKFGDVALAVEDVKAAADRLTEDPAYFDVYTNVNAATAEDIWDAMNETYAKAKEQADHDRIEALVSLKTRLEAGEISEAEYEQAKADLEVEAEKYLGEIAVNQCTVKVKQVKALFDVDDADMQAYVKALQQNFDGLLEAYQTGDISYDGLISGFSTKMNDLLKSGDADIDFMQQEQIAEYLEENAAQIAEVKAQAEELREAGEQIPEDTAELLEQWQLLEAMSGSVDAATELVGKYLDTDDAIRQKYLAVALAGKRTHDDILDLAETAPHLYDIMEQLAAMRRRLASDESLDFADLKLMFGSLGVDIGDEMLQAMDAQSPALQTMAMDLVASVKTGGRAEAGDIREVFRGFGVDIPDSMAEGIAAQSSAAQDELISSMLAMQTATADEQEQIQKTMEQYGIADAAAYINAVNNYVRAHDITAVVEVEIRPKKQKNLLQRIKDWFVGADDYTHGWDTSGGDFAPYSAPMPTPAPATMTYSMASPMAVMTDPEPVRATMAAVSTTRRVTQPRMMSQTSEAADRIAQQIAVSLQGAQITPHVTVEMTGGDVLLNGERVGRQITPTVSRIIAQQSRR